MSKTQQQLKQLQPFESLANEFETLAAEMKTCTNPERRIELLQRMKVLIDEIDGVIFKSLNRENKQARLPNPSLTPEESATS
jgi:hypothetical protein